MQNEKKVAFITSVSHREGAFYGAETSLKFLLNEIKDANPSIKFDVILRKSFLPWRNNSTADILVIAKFFEIETSQIKEAWIPYVTFPIERLSIKSFIRFISTNIIEPFFRTKINNLLIGYDFVHINNSHLYLTGKALKSKKGNVSQHIRDYIHYPSWMSNCASKYFAIDDTTFNSMPFIYKSNGWKLLNPYQKKEIIKLDFELSEIRGNYKFVFCIVGALIPIKGVDYVIKEFIKINNSNCCLVIAGGYHEKGYFTYLKKLVNGDSRIFFIGQVGEVEQVYNISDFNIRGDDRFCIGRTTIESCYWGLLNILPKKNSDKIIFESDNVSKLIEERSTFYDARIEGSLSIVIRKIITGSIHKPKPQRVITTEKNTSFFLQKLLS